MDPVYSSARDLAAAIGAKHVSAEEALEAHLAQIERYNPSLNAVITLGVEDAIRRAREADRALARGTVWGPLHGVPFTLKDSHSTAGMRTTVGYPPLAEHVPTEDGTVAARLKQAGGVLMGKTNVPPMLADIQTNNPIFGRTHNPWNVDRTPGGSSGGAAAALASGMTTFDIGTDIAGSIRIPSHFCGIFGLKTTENRVSGVGHIPGLPGSPRAVRVMATIGPMARDVGDLALLYSLIAGPDGRDAEVQPVPVDEVPGLALSDVRIAVAQTLPGYPVSAATRDAIRRLATALAPHCEALDEAYVPDLDYDPALLSEPVRLATEAIEGARPEAPIPLRSYLEALDRRDRFIAAWEGFFDVWDALICPASMSTAFPHCEPDTPLLLDGRQVPYWAANAHCQVFNYSGHPAVALPYELDSEGLPMGYQLVGKRWSEAKLLAIAGALSPITGTFRGPPPGATARPRPGSRPQRAEG